MNYQEVLERLKSLEDPETVKWMAKYGITPQNAYGISIPDLRKLAKEIGFDHQLARQLWKKDNRETRILASMIYDPKEVTKAMMDKWVQDFDYWEICDQVCMNIFGKNQLGYGKAVEWSKRKEEFVKRAGFVLMARLAVWDKKAEDERFERFLPLIKKEADDERNYVKKAINWALRQIGKRNLKLNRKAVRTAQEIKKIDSTAARWVAADAIRELKSDAVQSRFRK